MTYLHYVALLLGLAACGCIQAAAPDIRSVEPDLVVPSLSDGPPAPGRRVKMHLPELAGTLLQEQLYHVLYLPSDYEVGRDYPVIVEFSGNGGYRSPHGDESHGVPEGSNLGYGISAGRQCIWLCLPFVTGDVKVATRWWGSPPDYDPGLTVEYAKHAVRAVCDEFGGDTRRLLLCGFSRGAIACNFIGLYDDDIAQLWAGFVAYSHYDGVRRWEFPESDAANARIRLARLRGRPQFICHETLSQRDEGLDATRAYLSGTGVEGDFTFAETGFRNHNDAWVLRDSPCRRALRAWTEKLLKLELIDPETKTNSEILP